jgi:hypothetical protein
MGEPNDGDEVNPTSMDIQFSSLPDRYRARQPPPDEPPPGVSVVWIHFTSTILFGPGSSR